MFESGSFFTGANYWASHAGTSMWREWKPEVVDADLDRLKGIGATVLRVFPLWPDFQPLRQLYGGAGTRMEFRLGEEALPDEGVGFAGIDPVMLSRFEHLADAAAKRGMSLIVGLITGWMSGRLFVPPALEGRDPLTDPVSMMWQVRFVRAFVRRFKHHPGIGAWDLGNECNCMGRTTREQAWLWTSSIAGAIRVEDASRPVVSGMHSLPVDPDRPWSMRDQGELTDILCTHPYPRFTPHANLDPVGSIRASLHAAAETRLYADLGRRPAFIEEAGTLGPAYGDQERAAMHLRTMLFSGWMENQRGLLWWCGFDQTHLVHAPYDWNAVERELGLLAVDGSPKVFSREMASFHAFRKSLPFESLPDRITDAVCILGPDHDQWGVAYASYVLAAQAGLSLRFAWGSEELPESPLYFMPSIAGGRGVPRRTWMKLLERVEKGADLYLSLEDAIIAELERIAGVEIIHRAQRAGAIQVVLKGQGDTTVALSAETPVHMKLRATRAKIWAAESDGNPAITEAPYGKGRVVFSALPLELSMTRKCGAFHGPLAVDGYRLWMKLRDMAVSTRVCVKQQGRDVLVSEHVASPKERWVLLYNASESEERWEASLGKGWAAECVKRFPEGGAMLQGEGSKITGTLAPWTAAALRLRG